MAAPIEYRASLERLILKEARPTHKFGHQARLYQLCREIGLGLTYDDDVVFAAVWLHDLGVFEGNRPSEVEALQRWDHVLYAIQRCPDLLAHTNFPAAKISQVIAVIEEHQPQDTPTSIEATIVRDADILEQLGAIAILRTAAKLGSDTRFHRFADARDSLSRQLTALPAKLRLARSRELAKPRLQLLESFLTALDQEAGPNLG